MRETRFKDTEIGLIPEDWEVKKLGKIGFTYNGLTGKSAADFGIGSSRYITFLNVLNNPVVDKTLLEKVNVVEGEKQNAVKSHDLFFNTSSETPEEVGICSVLLEDIDDVYLNSFCFGYRLTDDEVVGLYLAYYFRSKDGRDLMATLAQGSTRYNLSKDSFLKSSIMLPSTKVEQKAIADALSEVDGLLREMGELIEKKKAIKMGMMQELLTVEAVPGKEGAFRPKRRLKGFEGDWVEKRLGDNLYFQSGAPFESVFFNKEYRGIRLIKNRDLKTDDIVVFYSGPYDDAFVVHNNDVLVGMDGDFIPCLWKKGVALLNQRVGRLLCDDSLDSTFLYHYLYWPLVAIQEGTGATTVKHLSGSNVENMVLAIPPTKAEQTTIAEVLSDMDAEIAALEAKRAKYEQVKNGMMQELLTGRIRLR